jgi:hypothetical protein
MSNAVEERTVSAVQFECQSSKGDRQQHVVLPSTLKFIEALNDKDEL